MVKDESPEQLVLFATESTHNVNTEIPVESSVAYQTEGTKVGTLSSVWHPFCG